MEYVHFHFPSIDSTNAWALRNRDKFDQDKITLVTADEQTAGRGRLKRSWKSPPMQNLYATFGFYHPNVDEVFFNQMAAVTVTRTLEAFGFHPKIKWPNDIFLSGKKVAGILCETTEVKDMTLILIGIGLNINMNKKILDTIDQPATSLLEETGKQYQVKSILNKLKIYFNEDLQIYEEKGLSYFLKQFEAKKIANT